MTVATLPEQLSDRARSFAAREHELLIDGLHAPAADGRTFQTLDPATGLPITAIAHAGAVDVDRAVVASRRALESGPWAGLSAAERGRRIEGLADLIEASADELAELESLDSGKPVKLAKIVDVASTVGHFR